MEDGVDDRTEEGVEPVDGNDILLEAGGSAGVVSSKVSEAEMADVSQLLDIPDDEKMEYMPSALKMVTGFQNDIWYRVCNM